MKKAFVVFAVFLCVIGSVFASGAKQTPPKETTLSVLWFNDANESDVFLATMADYLAKNPNIKLDMQIIAFSEYEQKLKMMIAGGNPPDVARLTNNLISSVITALLPLDGKIENLEGMKKQYLKASLAYATNADGQLVALPTESTANGMLVNKTAFKAAGVDIDTVSKNWTWNEWEVLMVKVLAANPTMKYALAVDFTPHRYSTLMFQQGGHFLNSTQTAMDFNNPGNIATLNLFKKYTDAGLFPKSVWLGSENPAQLFQAGLVASHIGGSWNINTYKQNVKNFEWGAVQMPKGQIRSSVPGGKFIASFKGAKNEKEALNLMKVFADKEHTEKYVRDTFNLSSRIDTQITYTSNNEDFAVFLEELKVTPAFTANEWKNTNLNKVTTYIKEQIVEVLLGKVTAEQAAKNIDEKGNTYFK